MADTIIMLCGITLAITFTVAFVGIVAYAAYVIVTAERP